MRSFFKKNSDDPEGPASVSEGVTVLVVDDSPTETHIISKILKDGGYTVITAKDGESGILEAQSSKPDVILMDVVMPGLNGFQATRQLTRAPETAEIPVILVTTKDQDTDRAWGLRQGAKDYVVKPVTATDLINKIKSILVK